MNAPPQKFGKSRLSFKDFFRDVDDNMGYNPEQLARGTEVEMEHTTDREMAATIAKQHLAEDPAYYTKHEKAGL